MTTAMSNISFNVTSPPRLPFVPTQSLQSYHISVATNVIIAVGMFGIGLTTDFYKIWYYLKRPKAYGIGVSLQLIIVPLVAWALTKIFVMNDIQALGVMIQGCSPGGSVSNVVIYWLDGVVDLSVAMTSTTTVLALGTMPLWLLIFEKGNNLDSSLRIPFRDLAITLGSFLGPLLVGTFCSWVFKKKKETSQKIAKALIVLASVALLVTLIVNSIVQPISWTLTWQQGVIVAIMPPIIYLIGHLICMIPQLKLNSKVRRTVGIEIALQNVRICISVLTTTFLATRPRIYGQIVLFPILYYIFQIGYSILYGVVLHVGRRYGFIQLEEEEMIEDESEEKKKDENETKKDPEDGKENPAYEKEDKL
uniref:ileal sodium/bile acid cotransporter-like isoform X2 n=1 Tax=Ciona intestinalis TaxID=7719 RepID=UPI000EF49113|nr:ileal sodium/bile acid cotransporter-like isoform X2 [Ciona intestinalis]|eukprot:XP_026694373.1 ileal sodium/bile acid cotransporter-like isoform X2 [Ciona intestinalis]